MERGFHLMRNEASAPCGTTVPCYPACFLPHNTFVFAFPFDRVLRELGTSCVRSQYAVQPEGTLFIYAKMPLLNNP
ncbi:hypothetical protein Barb4_01420 [Bacteroidales bacterium Barb4]|nr:hypothetical protein Barb4_01420 [Bacteroidales bacterium Barb4]